MIALWTQWTLASTLGRRTAPWTFPCNPVTINALWCSTNDTWPISTAKFTKNFLRQHRSVQKWNMKPSVTFEKVSTPVFSSTFEMDRSPIRSISICNLDPYGNVSASCISVDPVLSEIWSLEHLAWIMSISTITCFKMSTGWINCFWILDLSFGSWQIITNAS